MELVSRTRASAHVLLAGIRLVNGTAALVAPGALAHRLEVNAATSPGILYFERMFGVRTVLIALDLLTGDEQRTRRALRAGRIIHASDATAAALAGLRGNLKPKPAAMTTAISLVNLLLASIAEPRSTRPRARLKRLRPPRRGG